MTIINQLLCKSPHACMSINRRMRWFDDSHLQYLHKHKDAVRCKGKITTYFYYTVLQRIIM